jgi:hypothetical protein
MQIKLHTEQEALLRSGTSGSVGSPAVQLFVLCQQARELGHFFPHSLLLDKDGVACPPNQPSQQ